MGTLLNASRNQGDDAICRVRRSVVSVVIDLPSIFPIPRWHVPRGV